MPKYLCVLLFIIVGFTLIACTVTRSNETVPQEETTPIVAIHPSPSPRVSPSPSSVPIKLETVTSTPAPITTNMPETIPIPAASKTVSANSDYAPMLIATIEPDPYRNSFLPENVWWSEDSQTLYYQDIEAQSAWAYDLSTGASTAIAYEPRSLRELEQQIQASLPENASIVSVSPRNHFILYRKPLAEPIPIPDDSSIDPTPEVKIPNSFTSELWLRKDGQDTNLGLVDTCFGLLSSPLWSTNEKVVIVNGVGIDDVPCLHSVWFIDLETLSLGPLDSPWTENYRVLDLSANGDAFLVRSFTDHLNYLYDSKTNVRWSIPVDDTDRMTLIETRESPHCLVFELKFSDTILRDYVRYCDPLTGEINLLTTIEGEVSQGVVSPNQKFIALIVDNDFLPGITYENIAPGILLLALP